MIGRKFNHPPHNHGIMSKSGEVIDSLSNALNVHDADVHNSIVNRYLHRHTATATTLSVAVPSGGSTYQITVVSSAGFAVGDYIHIGNGVSESTHPRITVIAGNVITLDRRLDLAHAVGTDVIKVFIDMSSSAGTLASPIEYYIGPQSGDVWHITRILLSLVHGTAGDPGLFGDLSPLTNGVVIRVRRNGEYTTLTNWKTSGSMITDMFDVIYDSRSSGGGSYGTSGRGTFKQAGAVLRLDGTTNDRLEFYIQDNITGLDSFTVKAQGHLEEY